MYMYCYQLSAAAGMLISFSPHQFPLDKNEDNTGSNIFWEEISIQEAEEDQIGHHYGKLSPNGPQALFHALPHWPWFR